MVCYGAVAYTRTCLLDLMASWGLGDHILAHSCLRSALWRLEDPCLRLQEVKIVFSQARVWVRDNVHCGRRWATRCNIESCFFWCRQSTVCVCMLVVPVYIVDLRRDSVQVDVHLQFVARGQLYQPVDGWAWAFNSVHSDARAMSRQIHSRIYA